MVYIKVFIVYVKRAYKYINYKKPTEGIKEKGPELPVNKNIILNNIPPINYNQIFIYCGRGGKLIGCGRPKKVLKPIRFKVIRSINFFICF